MRARDGVPDWEQIARLIREWEPNVLVVGLPLNMDGSASDMSERAARFARRLNGRFQLPVETVDERLSTFEAKQHLKSQGRTPSSYRDDPVDSLAAALLLQTWLSSQSKETP